MLNIMLIDDEQPALEWLEKRIMGYEEVRIVGMHTNPFEALDHIGQCQPDIVFLDIGMPGLNGIEATERILAINPQIDIVFVTAYNHFATEAFELNAVDYLLKPVTAERLNKTIQRVIARRKTAMQRSATEGKARICCFGRFEVVDEVQKGAVKWRTSKERELLAYLVHHRNKIVAKEKILEDIWPEAAPNQAKTFLHTCVYNIRKRWLDLGYKNVLEYKNGGYRFNITGISCDVEQFERDCMERSEVTAENSNLCQKTVQLYTGNYLEEDGFLWALSYQERLKEAYMSLLLRMAAYNVSVSAYQAAAACYRLILQKNPFLEDANEQLLKVYALMGDRVSMVRHYKQFSHLLKTELGISPADTTVNLYAQLLSGSADDTTA